MGGGPAPEQRAAAASQANLANQEAKSASDASQIVKDQYAKINPFATSRLQNGLPYFNAAADASSGTVARSFAPARANLLRSQALFGNSLPNGFRQQSMTDLDAQQTRAYDDQLMSLLGANDAAKVQAAGLLTGQQQIANPQSYFGLAGQSNQSIMQAPLQRPGIGGLLGGIAGGALGALPI